MWGVIILLYSIYVIMWIYDYFYCLIKISRNISGRKEIEIEEIIFIGVFGVNEN